MKIFLLLFINFYLLNTYAAVKNDSQAFYNDIQMIESKSLDLINEIENLNSKNEIYFSKKMAFTPSLNLSAGKDFLNANSRGWNSADYWKISSTWNLLKFGQDIHGLNSAKYSLESQQYRVADEKLKLQAY